MRAKSKNIEYRNDRAGLLFLFSLLSLIFIADFIIEISKTGLFKTDPASYKYSVYELTAELNENAGYFDGCDKSIPAFRIEDHPEEIFGVKKLSIFFFLFASFAFFLPVFKPQKAIGELYFFPDIKFILFPKSKYALPRPPPERQVS